MSTGLISVIVVVALAMLRVWKKSGDARESCHDIIEFRYSPKLLWTVPILECVFVGLVILAVRKFVASGQVKNLNAFFIAAALYLAFGFVLFAYLWKFRVRLTATALVIRGLFGVNEIPFGEIYRICEIEGGSGSLHLEVSRKGRRWPIKLWGSLEYYTELANKLKGAVDERHVEFRYRDKYGKWT